ncbi:MAG: hypothetical protein Q8M07_28430 [Prosthecobacter sp.]|nr:hypothetical protein [Prosthecobacter sp.]
MKLSPSRILRELRSGQNPTVIKINLNDPRIIEEGVRICRKIWW